ncbi:MAG: hypothetical protein K2Q26_01010 [Bdellovibrionales bacterium]|nr:hypothetical protein [Bdellovibrionales bacterium]
MEGFLRMWVVRIYFFCLVLGFSSLGQAQPETVDLNRVVLMGGIEITLPLLPSDPVELEAFQALTPEEKASFYFKRKFLVEKLAAGVAKKGVGSSIRWTKDKVMTAVHAIKNLSSHAETVTTPSEAANSPLELNTQETELRFDRVPENMSEKSKAYVEATITSLVNNMWSNSVGIAKSSGVGITLVGGVIWNTTLGNYGYIIGRSLSIDIGVDFSKNTGYMNFYYDKQSKARGGFSIDVGLMFDFMIHMTEAESVRGEIREAIHQKLPLIGCFRSGPNYKAWGAQIGIHVVEMAGAVATVFGFPEIGLTVIPAIRALGMATIYKTSLERKALGSVTLASNSLILRKLGLSELQRAATRPNTSGAYGSCLQLFSR